MDNLGLYILSVLYFLSFVGAFGLLCYWLISIIAEAVSMRHEQVEQAEMKYCTDPATTVRGFEIVSGYEGTDVKIPERSTHKSAGYDIQSIETVVIPSGKYVLVETGVKCKLLKDEFLALYPRSSLATKHGLILANAVGIIDADYYNNAGNEGHIKVPLWNTSPNDYTVKKGDRICQGIIQNYWTTDDDTANKERYGGFGSTGD